MSEQQELFLAITGALGKLVILSMVIERGLAFIFEHKWFVDVFTKEDISPDDPPKSIQKSKVPGLKGIIALSVSIFLCVTYKFDILSVLFSRGSAELLGKVITGVVVAGGSSGAIAIFQGFLNINKESRDALLDAKKSQAEALKQIAESEAKEAKARAEEAVEKAKKAKAEAEAI